MNNLPKSVAPKAKAAKAPAPTSLLSSFDNKPAKSGLKVDYSFNWEAIMSSAHPIHEFLREIVDKLNTLLSVIRELPQSPQGVGMARAMLKRFAIQLDAELYKKKGACASLLEVFDSQNNTEKDNLDLPIYHLFAKYCNC